MAEELRFFFRTAIWILLAVVAYWILSREPAGTTLLLFLLAALVAFVAVAAAFVPSSLADLSGRGGPGEAGRDASGGRGASGGPLGFVNRLIGFHERTELPPPLRAESEIVPLGSRWPIIAAAALVVVGLGLIYGPWLLLPGVAVLTLAGIGWLTQLDR